MEIVSAYINVRVKASNLTSLCRRRDANGKDMYQNVNVRVQRITIVSLKKPWVLCSLRYFRPEDGQFPKSNENTPEHLLGP